MPTRARATADSRTRVALASLAVAVILAAHAAAASPNPSEPIPLDPPRLARTLAMTTASLHSQIDSWLARPDAATGSTPDEVALTALYQQRIYRLLVRDPQLARRTLRLLPRALLRTARGNVLAGRELSRLTRPSRVSRRIRVGPPLPAGVLRGYYREAERRFHVRWEVLAAINFVESRFGRVRSASSAGAEGPMQFLPSTWRRYGLGGNVREPHDAILGAANYLRASGAPGDYRRALYAYNRSPLYVDAVLRYAGRIRADRRAFYEYYAWQVFVRTPSGEKRLTGPGVTGF